MLYFAYGSNLSEQNRIKNNINITKVKNYKLMGYRICFRNPYGDPDIEKTSKGFVNGVLFKINSFQELNLDRYENFPSYYKKTYLKKPSIMFYEMVNKNDYSQPDQKIMKYILAGYEENNLSLISLKRQRKINIFNSMCN